MGKGAEAMRPITPQQNTKMRLRMRLLAAVLAVGCLGGLTVRLFVLMLRDPGGYAARAADQQLRVLKRCIKKGLSVRQVEELVRSLSEAPGKEAQNVEDEEYPESYLKLVEQLEKFFSQEISIKRAKNGGGKIVIGFTDDRDIEQFIERFAKRS